MACKDHYAVEGFLLADNLQLLQFASWVISFLQHHLWFKELLGVDGDRSVKLICGFWISNTPRPNYQISFFPLVAFGQGSSRYYCTYQKSDCCIKVPF